MRTSLLTAALILAITLPSRIANAQTLRIGTFDSRAVALAWYNSDDGRKEIGALFAELRSAKERNDRARIGELEALGPAQQQLMHQQVFSNGSILNLTAALSDRLAAVAKDAGVSLIVSKWEIAWHDPSVEYVDVTDALVDLMKPDAKARGWIAEMKSKDPLPLAEALAIRD